MKIQERYGPGKDIHSQGMRLQYEEENLYKPQTHVYAQLSSYKDEWLSLPRQYDFGHNLIVRNFGVAVAQLLSSTTVGIRYMAVGQGEGTAWDSLTQEERSAKSLFSLEELYDEVGRVAVETVFLDANNIEVEGPTNKLEVRALITPDISGDLREIALFVGEDATTELNSGLMINHKTFIKIPFNQDTGLMQTLAWAVRITL